MVDREEIKLIFFLQEAIIWGQEEHVDGFVQISAVSGE